MTAVDHAELKRLAEGAKPYWQAVDLACGGNPVAADLVAPFVGLMSPAVVLELLSEIEGLKAERDFAQEVSEVEIEDIDLEYAVVNLLHGRGALDKKTKTDAVVAVKTLRSIIKAAKALRPQTAESGE